MSLVGHVLDCHLSQQGTLVVEEGQLVVWQDIDEMRADIQ
jgi:hypothetical protein